MTKRRRFPGAINAALRETVDRTCIVRLPRNAMRSVSWTDRELIAQALRSVYRAETAVAGPVALDAFETGPGAKGTRRWRGAGGAIGIG